MQATYILDLIYFIAALTFVVGLKMLSHPDSARKGNQLAAVGMGIAVLGTLLLHKSALYMHGDARTLKLILIY